MRVLIFTMSSACLYEFLHPSLLLSKDYQYKATDQPVFKQKGASSSTKQDKQSRSISLIIDVGKQIHRSYRRNMSSLTLSESSTLLTLSLPPEDTDESDTDQPVNFDAFLKNVGICKLLMGFGLPICLGLEVAHLVVTTLISGAVSGGLEKDVTVTSWVIDIAGIIILVS